MEKFYNHSFFSNKFYYKLIYKGFKKLKKKSKFQSLFNLQKEINSINNFKLEFYESFLANEEIFNNIYIQKLSLRFSASKLFKKILFFEGIGLKGIFPLPYKIRALLNKHKFQCYNLISSIIFSIYSFFLLFFYMVIIFKKILKNLFMNNINNNSIFISNISNFNVFNNSMFNKEFFKKNFNIDTNSIHSNDINIKKYSSKELVFKYVNEEELNIPVKKLPSILFKSFFNLFNSFYSFILKRNDNFLVYDIFIDYLFIKENDHNKFYKMLLYNNTDYSRTPIFAAFNNLYNVNFYMYSSNIFPLEKYTNQKYKTNFSWDNFYYPNTIVWNKEIKNFILFSSKKIYESNFIIRKPIFKKKFISNKKYKKFKIGIFSTRVSKKLEYLINGVDKYPYTQKNIKLFYTDILNSISNLNSNNIEVYIKFKRVKTKFHSAFENNIYNTLRSSYPNIKLEFIDHDMDIISLISDSNLIISIPFTSPSLLASFVNINSFFYDPNSLLTKNDINNYASGIKIINDKKDLSNIINEKLNEHY